MAAAALLLVFAPPASAYDVGPVNSTDNTPVPDVNKAGLGQAGGIPANDLGCWAAAASNVLGAAGWGIGANTQAKADNIYQDLINAFGNPAFGYIDALGDAGAGAKWWVANIGLNVAKAGNGYTPTNTYINFRQEWGTLFEKDYNFLLGELGKGPPGQYAAVKWLIPNVGGHCVTLVGGNYGPNGPQQPPTNPGDSVWHDSDSNAVGGLADEVRRNRWGNNTEWYLDMGVLGNQADDWFGDGYFTACPGAPKPENAIANFDVHYFTGITSVHRPADETPHCELGPMMLTTGNKYGVYTAPSPINPFDPNLLTTDPYWEDPNAVTPTLIVPNQSVEDMKKTLYLLIDFNDPLAQQVVPNITVQDNQGNVIGLDGAAQWASDNGEVLLKYTFDTQPAWEKIIFPSQEYLDLMGQNAYNVYEWNIATECTPEPATLALVGLGVAGLLARRRTRK